MRAALRDDPECRFLIRRWANGESALPVVERLIEIGSADEAGAMGRLALAYPDCKDRQAIEHALREVASEPTGWQTALEEFAKNPSEDRWNDLMRFVRADVFYQRLRTTVPMLMRLGCDGNVLFRCVAQIGMTPDLFDLANSGTVDPDVIEHRAAGSPASAAWLGLAAQAAFARNDRFNTIRYLREALRDAESAVLAWGSMHEIRDRADEEFVAQLDQLGFDRLI